MKNSRILGIDPGFATTGYAVLEKKNNSLTPLDAGIIATPKTDTKLKRLETIYDDCLSLIKTYRPSVCAVEELFFAKNARTAFMVGQARGVILLACAQSKLPVYEYTPLQVKMAVTGYGNATKKQVQYMVQTLLKLQTAPKPDDVADAIAIAICHANRGNQATERGLTPATGQHKQGSDPIYRGQR